MPTTKLYATSAFKSMHNGPFCCNSNPQPLEHQAFDEIDNASNNDLSTEFALKDSFRSEAERLKTFKSWPVAFIDKCVLAQTGLVYTRRADMVRCYFCEVEFGRWEKCDHPVSEHIKWSTDCPLMRRRETNNIPINADALKSILPPPPPPVSYDVCGSEEVIEVRPNACPEESISSASLPIGPMDMKYPEYAIEAVRHRSFAEWPRAMKQKPKELAEAGFFYTGIGDRVNCFSCGGGMKNWDENDKPWEQHAQWLGKCRYLNLMKDEAFIYAGIAKHKLSVEKSNEALSDGNSDTKVQNCGTQMKAQQHRKSSSLTATNCLLQRSDSSSLEKRTIPEEKVCKICYAAEYNTMFLPCGHVVACAKCASSVTICPMCRTPFRDVKRVYFS